ncbi:MAG TPA: pyridoxal phosphate-dependent class II aminotransferase, partial [Dyadobacter sp.]|nr:pyridoxal phosphate-dependent class II aminotransferase [Dyadobacter sp.]
MLLGHGDDGYRYGQKIVADFSTNVWYGGEPAGLKEYVINSWQDVNRYPEVISESLRNLIAAHHQLPESYIQIS